MQRYLISRALQSVVLLFGVIVIVFFLIRLTGDPVSLMVPKEASAEAREAFREAYGFNRPIMVQFFDYFWGVLRLDLGDSLKFREPALGLIMSRLPQTFLLATLGLVIAILVAIPIGIYGGFNPGSWVDTIGRGIGLIGQSTPSFVLALYLILFFSVNLGWLPTLYSGDNVQTLIMPAVALSIGAMGQLVRLTRSAVLEIRNEDYIRTARSKGLSGYAIGLRHVARNASLAIISVVSILYTYSMAGTILIESIFAFPGLGNLLNGALIDRDFFLIQAIAVVFAFIALTIRFLTDILYALVAIWAGFIGAGSGSMIFYIMMLFFGFTINQSSATQKIPALVSTSTALIIFIVHGLVNWPIGIIFFVGMMVGGYLGAHLALKIGNAWVKLVYTVMVVLLTVKMLFS